MFTCRQMNMDEDHQLLTVQESKEPSNYPCVRFMVVVLTLVLIVAASAIVGELAIILCEKHNNLAQTID